MNAAHRYLAPIVAKQRRKRAVIAAVMLVVFGVGAAWGFSLDFSQYPSARLSVLVALCTPIWMLSLVWNVLPHRGLALLSDASRVVWYYGVHKGGQVHRVMVGFDDGKLHRFELPLISFREGFSQEAFRHLQAAAPGATVGFSEARRQAFCKDPASLKTG